MSPMTGFPAVSPSGLPWDNNKDTYPYKLVGGTKMVLYHDHTPIMMTVEDIKSTIGDYCTAAKVAVEECGFDGVEVHGGNGYAA
jgi:2,4-dienoyl-CoA reductase-like NADH-dependent reductase (Old Yellow Enzyme family)